MGGNNPALAERIAKKHSCKDGTVTVHVTALFCMPCVMHCSESFNSHLSVVSDSCP